MCINWLGGFNDICLIVRFRIMNSDNQEHVKHLKFLATESIPHTYIHASN